jgi:hypothetical protein
MIEMTEEIGKHETINNFILAPFIYRRCLLFLLERIKGLLI